MTAALLLSLAVAADSLVPAYTPRTTLLANGVEIRLNSDGAYWPGDRARVEIRSVDDGYLVVLHSDAEGRLRVLFPIDPEDDNYVRGGRTYKIVGRNGRDAFTADASGRGTILAAVARDPFNFGPYSVNGHWDYARLNQERYPEDAEPELLDLVQRMSTGRFDYDARDYSVGGRVAGGGGGGTTVIYNDYDGWPGCFGCGWGSGVTVSLGWGRPWGWYDGAWGWRDPWAYDPWYWGPSWYYPTWYSSAWHGGWYGGWYGAGWRRPYAYNPWGWRAAPPYRQSPYEFKRTDRRWAGTEPAYRDRMYGTQLVNTVVGRMPQDGRTQQARFTGRRWNDDLPGGGIDASRPDRGSRPVGSPTDGGRRRSNEGPALGTPGGRSWSDDAGGGRGGREARPEPRRREGAREGEASPPRDRGRRWDGGERERPAPSRGSASESRGRRDGGSDRVERPAPRPSRGGGEARPSRPSGSGPSVRPSPGPSSRGGGGAAPSRGGGGGGGRRRG